MAEYPGHWSTEVLAGHPVEVYHPPELNKHGYVLLYLHGMLQGRLEKMPRFCNLFAEHQVPVIAPMTKQSWWTDRICREFDPSLTAVDHLMQNVLPWIADRFDAAPPRIGLFGTSMGGQGALRLAYQHPDTFPVVAAIAPAVDYQTRMTFENDPVLWSMYDDPESCRQETATLHIHPLNWPRQQFFCCDPTDERWIESSDRLAMKLSSLGVPHERDLETVGGGHGISYYNTMAERVVTFLLEGLRKERLRVV